MAKIVIIGGGIIGLSAAWELHLQGEEVVVLDARTAGMAASAANAGYIATSLPGPVPTPGLVKTSMKWMLDPESPLYIRPRADKHFRARARRTTPAWKPAQHCLRAQVPSCSAGRTAVLRLRCMTSVA